MRFSSLVAGGFLAAVSGLSSTATWAQDSLQGLEPVGKPFNGFMGFQPAVTKTARDLQWLDNALLLMCVVIVVFVTALLAIVVLRYNQRANPKPATFTHNSLLEAANFIRVVEERQGLKISCPEEIAYRMGFITRDQLLALAEPLKKSGYGIYLARIANEGSPS